MAAILRCTKITIQNPQPGGLGNPLATVYYTNPTLPGNPASSITHEYLAADTEDPATFRGQIDGVFDGELGNTIDWTL